MVNILAKNNLFCTGCEACYNICPVNAISMDEDSQGFLQAQIKESACIKCGQCEDVCPVLSQRTFDEVSIPRCFAVIADDETRFKSSSGGAFWGFAQKVINEGGVVIGAALDSELAIRHIAVETINDLLKIQKSKYAQSRLGSVYQDMEHALQSGKTVLFSGCPCEVAGINAYFGTNNSNLITVDILCHGVPSQKMLKESLEATIGLKSVKSIDFRDKNYGWECLGMTLTLNDNSKQRFTYDESRYAQGFHSNMSLRPSCYDCKFCDLPRCGDITIGDFWNIADYDVNLDDKKGTSAVLVNTDKGVHFFEMVKNLYKVCKPVPFEYLKKNRLSPQIDANPARNYFLDLYPGHDFNTAVVYAQQGKFDIGLVGNWSYPNYGSELTYYALYSVLKQMGLSVLLISWPKESHWKPYDKPQLFSKNPYQDYEIAPLVQTRYDLRQYSDKCKTFVLGSDQLLNNNLYHWFDKFMQLDWVTSNKRKIAYAASFGCDYIWGSDEDRAELAHFLQKFDFFSMREKSGVTLAKEHYGVSAEWVVDPVFLQPSSFYENIAQQAQTPEANYLFTYILDISKEKEDVLLEYANHLSLVPYAALDADQEHNNGLREWGLNTVHNLCVEEWLAYIKNCEFMVTDSFHGMCFAILFHKPFIAISNSRRGKARFVSILCELGLESRLVNSEQELRERLQMKDSLIDYEKVDRCIQKLAQRSIVWLQRSIRNDLPVKTLSSFDFMMDSVCSNRNEFNEIWGQLENHKKRLEGLDALQQDYFITNKKQWTQLEDHRSRLDGSDALWKEHEATNKKQWEQLEDHRMRLDGIDAMQVDVANAVQVQNETNTQFKACLMELQDSQQNSMYKIEKQISDMNQEIALLQDGILNIGTQILQMRNSYSYKIGRIITYIPRKIRTFIRDR